MKLKSLKKTGILSAVICGALMATAATIPMRAEAATLLQPESDWSVARFAARQQGGDPYCALARRFGENVILTMALNARKEASIALDFQREFINKTQNYIVILRTGAGQERSFTVRPVSGKAVVIRLGQDVDFLESLAISDYMTAEVAGSNYMFNIPDFLVGRGSLAKCVATLEKPADRPEVADVKAPLLTAPTQGPAPVPAPVQAAPIAPATAAPTTMASQEPIALTPPASQQQAPMLTAGQSASAPASVPAPIPVQAPSLPATMTIPAPAPAPAAAAPIPDLIPVAPVIAAAPIAAPTPAPAPIMPAPVAQCSPTVLPDPQTEAALLTVRSDNARLQNDVDILSRQLNEARQAVEISKQAVETSRQVAEASKLEATAAKAAEITAANARLSDLQSRLDAMSKENQALRTAANTTNKAELEMASARLQDLQNRVNTLLNENQTLRASLSQVQVASVASTGDVSSLAQIRVLEEQLRAVQQERDLLAREIEKFHSGKGEDLLKLSSNNWDLEQATRRFNEAEREIRRLGLQIEQERGQCNAEKKKIEYMLFDPQIASQEQARKLATLEGSLAQAQTRIIQLENQLAMAPADAVVPTPPPPVPVVQKEPEEQPAYVPPPTLPDPAVVAEAPAPVVQGSPEIVMSHPMADPSMDWGAPAPVEAGPIEAILAQAHIETNEGIRLMNAPSPDVTALSWSTGALYGSAEQTVMKNEGEFDTLAQNYLERIQTRCPGEFAAVPAYAENPAPGKMDAYDVACMGDAGSASVSVLFFNNKGKFTTIAHESAVDAMDSAIEVRDRVMGVLLQAKMVSR